MVKLPWFHREPPPAPRRGYRGFLERHLPGVFVVLMVAVLLGFVLYPYMLITVPSGQAGVLWKRFSGPGIYCLCILPNGTVLDPAEVRNEGLHFIWPWDMLFLYDMRLQTSTEKFNAISLDGVSVAAEITIRYQLDHNWIGVLHQFIGPNYLKTVLTPEIGSVTRSVIAKYMAEDVYSTKRQQIEKEIKEAAISALKQHLDSLFQASASAQEELSRYETALQNSIQILDTLVLSIELPADIVSAINRKTEQYYMIQEYRYRVQREIEESRRKQIEADGIAGFQRTVSQGISNSYLRWEGIQATLALAQSKNTKIVIIGNGKDGLPIILGNTETPVPPVSQDKPNDSGSPLTQDPSKDSPAPTGRMPPAADDRKNALLDLSSLEALIARLNDALHNFNNSADTKTSK